jgi:hypothetical protein
MRACLLLCLCACSGGGDKVCTAPPDAGVDGILVTVGADSLPYGSFKWGANNDCPQAGSSVVSVTIIGEQVGGGGSFGMGFCLPRPDLIDAQAVSLADDTKLRFESLTGEVGGCVIAKAGTPSGTATFEGFCSEAGASYNVRLDGQVAGTSQCGSGPTTPVTLVLSGTAVVVPR